MDSQNVTTMITEPKPFGRISPRKTAKLYSLENNQGMKVDITDYGATMVSLIVPDKYGIPGDIVLGYDSLEEYIEGTCFFGCTVGRYANRIAHGRFTLNGKQYLLAQNENKNHIHGGILGFDKVLWNTQIFDDENGIQFSYLSKDGEEGYPGNVSVKVKYKVTEDNELRIDYQATTDKPTVINLTNHTYFNLAGAGCADILNHDLFIDADLFTPVGNDLIPTGELKPVAGTPLDFTCATRIGARINQDYQQILLGHGYDHNWVLNTGNKLSKPAARVYERESGRIMELFTTHPGLQFYSGNCLENQIIGKNGKTYTHHGGFCLETQHYPDSPNQPHFPSTILEPGSVYEQTTIFRFSVT